jgi:O-antigen chain-terminating methyltransferase
MAEPDVEEIVAEIRRRVASRRADSARETPIQHAEDVRRAQMTADLETLQAAYDIAQARVVSHRALTGAILVRIKRLLGFLLAPFLGQQVVYNAANARFTRDLADDVGALDRRLETLTRQHQEQGSSLQWQLGALADEWRAALRAEAQARDAETALLRAETAALQAQTAALQAETAAVQAETVAFREVLTAEAEDRRDLEDRVRDQASALADSLVLLKDRMIRSEARWREGSGGPPVSAPERRPPAYLDGVSFAEQFRGSEAEIRERQRVYLPCFAGQQAEILDLGCGRGEFLELLREAGQRARGVELDHAMAGVCRAKGLDVTEDEFFTHLEALPDGTLGGVFSAQVVEHLEPDDIVALIRLIHRKLAPGGVVVLETVNPECLWTFAATFYIDLTHRRPVHAKALRFVLESRGFRDVEVRYLAPVDSALHIPSVNESMLPDGEGARWNRSIATLNGLLYGPQEYAVIGRKAVP